MIDSDGYPNIIDFGFAKATTEKAYTFCGTPEYAAPEIILLSGHSVGVDHWALGIMIYEMICGEHPFYYAGKYHHLETTFAISIHIDLTYPYITICGH